MRSAWWLFLLFLGFPASLAAAQGPTATAGGQVVQIGFDGHFQPSGWVPMRVAVSPPGGQSGFYLLRVHQRDLDGDQVIYQRTITLTGGMPNQEFWTYFKPQPVETIPWNDTRGLNERLRVVLCDEAGRELAQLAVQINPFPLYSGTELRTGGGGRGKRLVLLVGETGGHFPATEDHPERLIGLTEEIVSIAISPRNLPDQAIGYESVDAIIWQDADPEELLEGAGERMAALRQWVAAGGKLVVTGRSEWQSLQPFFDLLPVTPVGAVERPDLAPMAGLAVDRARGVQLDLDAWRNLRGPFRYILATPKQDALIERTFTYEVADAVPGEVAAPFIARRAEGFGSVTWLAVDVSHLRNLPRTREGRSMGWNIVRAHLLGTADTPIFDPPSDVRARYEARDFRDLGGNLLEGSRLAGRSMALVTVALVFFIAYWIVAGPGLYFYLMGKGRTPMSWFFFGATAVVATLVTLGVVRLILRGPPDLRHLTVARMGATAPQIVHSDLGLYIPEDGVQRLMVDGGAPVARPTLTALSIDPAHQPGDGRRSNPITYIVSLDPPDERLARGATGSATVVEIPYRSTLKKLEASWIGPASRGIDGTPRLVPASEGFATGSLVNNTGHDLVNVHIAFRHPDLPAEDDVYLLFIPLWRSGTIIQGLNTVILPEGRRIRLVDRNTTPLSGPPGPQTPVAGIIRLDWSRYWYSFLRGGIMQPGAAVHNDWNETIRRTPAMLSFFDLLPPMMHDPAGGLATGGADSSTLLRRGRRYMDVSPAVVAGNMVIVAEADNAAVPMPLKVEGSAVRGTGRIIFQVVLPLERAALDRQRAERRARQGEEEPPGGEGEAEEPPTEEPDPVPSTLQEMLAGAR